MKIECRCCIKKLLTEKSGKKDGYDYKVKLSWKFITMSDIREDDFYTAF